MIKFIEHVSYPGFGYVEPYMDADDPLIHQDVGEMLVEAHNTLLDDYCKLLEDLVEIRRWYDTADRSAHSWAELDKIMENQND